MPLGKTGTRYARAMNRLGWHWWPSEVAVAPTEYDGRGKCINLAGLFYWVPGWWEEVWVACLQGLYHSRRGRRELATLREDPPIWWYRIWSTSRH